MNQSNFFSHNFNARNDNKVLNLRMALGAEGYGIFFMLLERLGEEAEYMSVKDYNAIAFDLRVDTSKIKKVVEDFGLFVFTEDGEYFYSESFNARMAIKDNVSKKKSIAGKKGADKRWGKENIAEPLKKNSSAITDGIAEPLKNMAIKRKETKEKEIKLKQQQEKDVVVVLDTKIKDLAKLYENSGFGQINLTVSEKLNAMLEDFEYSWIEEAFVIAANMNKHSIAYVNGILENWRKNGKDSTKPKTKRTKFHNFEQATDSMSEQDLEDVAKRKREQALKELGL